jgi:hypothetical protein
MDMYLAQVDKLKRDLRDSDLDDHKWELRSWNQDGVEIVKLFCKECRKKLEDKAETIARLQSKVCSPISKAATCKAPNM